MSNSTRAKMLSKYARELKLSAKEEAFCYAYHENNGHGTNAAKSAGYIETGAHVTSSRLLKKGKVIDFLAKLKEETIDNSIMSAQEVLQELTKIGRFDPRKLFMEDGSPKPITVLDDDTAAAITGIELVTKGNSEMGIGEIQKVRVIKKTEALRALGEHHNLFKDHQKAGAGEIHVHIDSEDEKL